MMRGDRLRELDGLIDEGLGDVPGTRIPGLTRWERYNLRRKAHPRMLQRRPNYEPPEVRREIYLREKTDFQGSTLAKGG